MIIDLEATQGEWFPFFGSHINMETGETVYEEPTPDARVQIRSMAPFYEDRLAKRQKKYEHVYNPKTRQMERVAFYQELTPAEEKAEREDAWDYTITGIEGFVDSKTGDTIACTRENKLKLMKLPVFDRFMARCLQILNSAGIKEKEDEEKN